MADDLTNRSKRDKARTELGEDYGKHYWDKGVLGKEQLKEAVDAADRSRNKEKNYLQVKAFINKLRDYVKRHRSARGKVDRAAPD